MKCLAVFCLALCSLVPSLHADDGVESPTPASGYRKQTVEEWTVHVSLSLLDQQKEATLEALSLLGDQLRQIARIVPAEPLAELRKVPLWISPPYEGFPQRAEYHPNPGWLRDNKRDPAMAKAVEFTSVAIFKAECQRMPMLALHELAHAYHDRVLGFEHEKIEAAYQRAKESQSYDAVKRHNGRVERAYAMTNAKEYFAECSEAFFGRNDFFPFDRDELKQHDPQMFALLARLWQIARQE
jgi:hypothetical protein